MTTLSRVAIAFMVPASLLAGCLGSGAPADPTAQDCTPPGDPLRTECEGILVVTALQRLALPAVQPTGSASEPTVP